MLNRVAKSRGIVGNDHGPACIRFDIGDPPSFFMRRIDKKQGRAVQTYFLLFTHTTGKRNLLFNAEPMSTMPQVPLGITRAGNTKPQPFARSIAFRHRIHYQLDIFRSLESARIQQQVLFPGNGIIGSVYIRVDTVLDYNGLAETPGHELGSGAVGDSTA